MIPTHSERGTDRRPGKGPDHRWSKACSRWGLSAGGDRRQESSKENLAAGHCDIIERVHGSPNHTQTGFPPEGHLSHPLQPTHPYHHIPLLARGDLAHPQINTHSTQLRSSQKAKEQQWMTSPPQLTKNVCLTQKVGRLNKVGGLFLRSCLI